MEAARCGAEDAVPTVRLAAECRHEGLLIVGIVLPRSRLVTLLKRDEAHSGRVEPRPASALAGGRGQCARLRRANGAGQGASLLVGARAGLGHPSPLEGRQSVRRETFLRRAEGLQVLGHRLRHDARRRTIRAGAGHEFLRIDQLLVCERRSREEVGRRFHAAPVSFC